MRTIQLPLMIGILLLVAAVNAADSGIVNFNLGRSPIEDSPVQPVTLYGCNKVVNSNLFWNTDNQIVGHIPYGKYVSKSKKPYYVSKYYIASPPAFRKGEKSNSKKQQPYIGLVTPDSFTFHGEKPAQIVYFDYRILNPTYLTFVSVDYQHNNDKGETCEDLGVDLIPVNTTCADFPWRNGALGASGIGEITQKNNDIFLPLRKKGSLPLQCDVTILDDILLDFEIFFMSKNSGKTKTVSLTEYHKRNKELKLLCFPRGKNNIPSGCCSSDIEACSFAE